MPRASCVGRRKDVLRRARGPAAGKSRRRGGPQRQVLPTEHPMVAVPGPGRAGGNVTLARHVPCHVPARAPTGIAAELWSLLVGRAGLRIRATHRIMVLLINPAELTAPARPLCRALASTLPLRPPQSGPATPSSAKPSARSSDLSHSPRLAPARRASRARAASHHARPAGRVATGHDRPRAPPTGGRATRPTLLHAAPIRRSIARLQRMREAGDG